MHEFPKFALNSTFLLCLTLLGLQETQIGMMEERTVRLKKTAIL